MRKNVAIISTVLTVLLSTQLWADEIRLRHVTTDGQGNFTVFFSALYEGGNPIGDVSQIPLDNIRIEAGLTISDTGTLDVENVELTTLRTDNVPFHVTALLPDVDLFNGVEGDSSWPDAMRHRSSLASALLLLPIRDNVRVHVGVFNTNVIWLPLFTTEQASEISTALLGTDYAAPPGNLDSRIEDVFGAIDVTYRTRLRSLAREDSADVIRFFVVITSSLGMVAGDEFDDTIDYTRQLLDGREMSDVIPIVLVFDPFSTTEQLSDPTGEHLRFADGITPNRGTFRLVNNPDAAERAFNQTLDEIGSTFILRFSNADLELNEDYQFRVGVTLEGEEILSNRLPVRLQAPEVEASPEVETDAPTEEADTPTEETETPVEETDSPTEETETPVEETDSPVEETDSPVEESDSPVEEIETPPSNEIDTPPIEETDTPVEETDTPTEEIDTPAEDDVVPASEEETDESETPTEGEAVDENEDEVEETEDSTAPVEDEIPSDGAPNGA